jgi:ribosomal protein S18 acetylase RimI-like enzyme
MPGSISTDLVVRQLSTEQIRAAVGVLSRSFDEDPVFTFYFNNAFRRKLAYRPFFGDIIRSNLRFGHVYSAVLDHRVVAAAIWRPPDAGPPNSRERVQSFAAALCIRAIFPRTAQGLFEGFDAMQAVHPKEPHWYLAVVGVDTDLQGKTIGSRVLAPVLECADQAKTLCYVETPFPRDLVFYERLGFEIVSESYPFPGAPQVWAMLRTPKGVSQGSDALGNAGVGKAAT